MSTLHQVAGCDNPRRQVDVVFIHGLGGDAFGTWRCGDADDTFWPNWLAEEVPEAGVWTLSYPAGPTRHLRWVRRIPWIGRRIAGPDARDAGHAAALPDRAVQVLDQLRLKKAFGLGQRPLVWICHSLGGLLAKHLLRASADATDPASQALAGQTRGVLFLATPHTGAKLASLLDTFRVVFQTTIAIEELREHDAHLRNLHVWYRERAEARGWQTETYFEMRPVGDVLPIVNPTSADSGVGRPVGLDKDHLSIAKPLDRNEQVFEAAVALVRRTLAPSPPGPGLPTGLSVTPVGEPARPVRHELPLLPTHGLFGRVVEKKRLMQRLLEGQTTWVVGPAGIGKTGLAAVALAEALGHPDPNVRARKMYPDGVIYLDLYALKGQLESAAAELANRLSEPPDPGGDELARARRACAGRGLLLVIEGAEEAASDPRRTPDDLLAVLDRHSRALVLTRDLAQADPARLLRLDDRLSEPEAQAMLDTWLADADVTPELRSRVLRLADGHPLTLTWAGGLLMRKDEPAALLVADWEAALLPAVSDPRRRDHNLAWLFERSVRRLDEDARQVLAAIGVLAYAPVDLDLLSCALGDMPQDAAEQRVRAALRRCVQQQLLRHDTAEGGPPTWQCSHVLAYKFARAQLVSASSVRERLGENLAGRLQAALARPLGSQLAVAFATQQHAVALLGYAAPASSGTLDEAKRLYFSLVNPLLFGVADRWSVTGFLGQCLLAVQAVQAWLQQAPLEADPSNTEWQRDLSISHDRIGDVRQAQGDLPAALAKFSESLSIAQRLAQADPSNSQWQHDLSISHERIGDVRKARGDLPGALAAFSESLSIRQRLVQADPSNSQWQRDLSISQNKIGGVRQFQDDLSGALVAFSESLSIVQRLAQADPSKTEWQRGLSISQNKIGDVRQAQGDLSGALAAFSEGLSIARRLAQTDPSNTEWQRDLSVSYNKIGGVRQAQGDLPGALAAYSEGLSNAQRLAEADPSNTDWQRDLSVSYNRIGDVRLAQGDLPGALAAYSEGLSIAQRLAHADPSNTEWQRDLSISHERIGNIRQAQGDQPGALTAFSESLSIRQRLTQADPTNAQWQRDLSFIRDRIGKLQR